MAAERAELAMFYIDNSSFHSTAPGLHYRLTTEHTDRAPHDMCYAPWESILRGKLILRDNGTRWIEVGHKYLPMHVEGKPVIQPLQLGSGTALVVARYEASSDSWEELKPYEEKPGGFTIETSESADVPDDVPEEGSQVDVAGDDAADEIWASGSDKSDKEVAEPAENAQGAEPTEAAEAADASDEPAS